LGFSVTMSGIVVIAVLFIAVASSISLMVKAYTQAVRSMEEVSQRIINRERSSIAIANAYANATEGLLYVTLNNTGSLDLWDFNSSDLILIYWSSSTGLQASRSLRYETDWNVSGIIAGSGSSLLPFSGYIPPGQAALITAELPPDLNISRGYRIDFANQYGFVASYEATGGG